MGSLEPDKKKDFASKLNSLKTKATELLENQLESFDQLEINKKLKTLKSSTKKYCELIFLLQSLHFPLNNIKDIKGILSNHLIVFPQFGQYDLFTATL